MDRFFDWLSNNPVATAILLSIIGVVVLIIIIIYTVAFFQGRSISFWPPKVGEKLKNSPTYPSLEKKDLEKPSPWSERNKKTLKPGLDGASDLENLIKLFGEVSFWLVVNDTQIMRRIKNNLWEVIADLEIERDAYFAVHLHDIRRQLWILRRFTQIEKDKSEEVMNWIINNPNTPDKVRATAIQYLDEINRRLESRNNV